MKHLLLSVNVIHKAFSIPTWSVRDGSLHANIYYHLSSDVNLKMNFKFRSYFSPDQCPMVPQRYWCWTPILTHSSCLCSQCGWMQIWLAIHGFLIPAIPSSINAFHRTSNVITLQYIVHKSVLLELKSPLRGRRLLFYRSLVIPRLLKLWTSVCGQLMNQREQRFVFISSMGRSGKFVQPTTGFALIGAHQVGMDHEICSIVTCTWALFENWNEA